MSSPPPPFPAPVVSAPRPAGAAPSPPALQPYRLFFPLGLAYALAGAVLWPLAAARLIGYPGPLHAQLMIEGFQLCFVLGFLFTAIRAFTKSGPTRPAEAWLAFAAAAAFGLFSLARLEAAAQAGFALAAAVALVAVLRRLPRRAAPVPEAVVLLGVGLAMGVAGAAVQAAAALGWAEPSPRFGLRLVTLGMMLAIVLGVGSVLLPTFMATVAAPVGAVAAEGRRGRWVWNATLGAALIAAMAIEAAGMLPAAAGLRAVAALAAAIVGWRLDRLPGKRGLFEWSLWSAGWLTVAGLVLSAVITARPLPGFHVAFLGGFGLLTMAIASRVVTVHAGLPPGSERRVLRADSLALLGGALLARLGAEAAGPRAALLFAASGALWTLAWLLWGLRSWPLLRGPGPVRPH